MVQMGPKYIFSCSRMQHVVHTTLVFVDKQNARVTGSQGLAPRYLEPLKPGSMWVASGSLPGTLIEKVCETFKFQHTPKMLDTPHTLVGSPRH